MSRQTPEGGGIVGFVFGLLLGAGTTASLFAWDVPLGVAIVAALVVGIVGFIFGDRFWYWFLEKVQWFV